MNQAPLQLIDYWVDDIEVHSNPDYDREQSRYLDTDSFAVEASTSKVNMDDESENYERAWVVNLEIKQGLDSGKNVPYSFSLNISGIIVVNPSFPEEKLNLLVEVNGPSVLFGAAREILRAATGRGPYPALLIPSTDFLDRLPKKAVKKPAQKTTRKRKPPKKDEK